MVFIFVLYLMSFILHFKYSLVSFIFQKGKKFSVCTGAILSEEELAAMSPTAAAVAKIVKPGMKLTEVRTIVDFVSLLQKHSDVSGAYLTHPTLFLNFIW